MYCVSVRSQDVLRTRVESQMPVPGPSVATDYFSRKAGGSSVTWWAAFSSERHAASARRAFNPVVADPSGCHLAGRTTGRGPGGEVGHRSSADAPRRLAPGPHGAHQGAQFGELGA